MAEKTTTTTPTPTKLRDLAMEILVQRLEAQAELDARNEWRTVRAKVNELANHAGCHTTAEFRDFYRAMWDDSPMPAVLVKKHLTAAIDGLFPAAKEPF